MTADKYPIRAILAVDFHMQEAATAHFRALFTHKARAGSAGQKAVTDHVNCAGPGRTACRWIFGDPIFGSKHSLIGAFGRRRKQEHAEGLALFAFEGSKRR